MLDNSEAAYTPFDVAFDELESAHMDALRNVREGWYVDYKEAHIKTKDYAKVISAMVGGPLSGSKKRAGTTTWRAAFRVFRAKT